MAKRSRKRKLTGAEKAAKRLRRRQYQTVFINGKKKHVRRPPMIDGLTVDEFIRQNADPIFLHREELWEYLEAEIHQSSQTRRPSPVPPNARELVSFISTETGEDLIVAYAIATAEPDEVVSLILQRTPRFEMLLPPEERGVSVSHEAQPEIERELATRITVKGPNVDIETTGRVYQLDLTNVEDDEVADARKVLRRMHQRGGFRLELQ